MERAKMQLKETRINLKNCLLVLIQKQFKANLVLVQIFFNQQDPLNYSTTNTQKVVPVYNLLGLSNQGHSPRDLLPNLHSDFVVEMPLPFMLFPLKSPQHIFQGFSLPTAVPRSSTLTSSWNTHPYVSAITSPCCRITQRGLTTRYTSQRSYPAPSLAVETEAYKCDCCMAANQQTVMAAETGTYSGHFWGKSCLARQGYVGISLALASPALAHVYRSMCELHPCWTVFHVQLLKFICSKTSIFEGDYNRSQQERFP